MEAEKQPREPEDRTLWRKFAKDIMNEVTSFKTKGRLLDIGCGFGAVLDYAREVGFQVMGIELDDKVAEYGRRNYKLDIRSGNVMEYQFKEKFDVIITNHVIEHIENPIGFLKKAGEVMKGDGILLVGTPNVDGWMRSILGRRWYPYCPEEHFYLYNTETLSNVLEKAGFTVLRVRKANNHYGGLTGILFYLPLKLFKYTRRGGDNIIITARKKS